MEDETNQNIETVDAAPSVEETQEYTETENNGNATFNLLANKHLNLEYRVNIIDILLDKVCKLLQKNNFSLTESELDVIKKLAETNTIKNNPEFYKQ